MTSELQNFEVVLDDVWKLFMPCAFDKESVVEDITDYTIAWAQYIVKLKKDALAFWEFADSIRASSPAQFAAVIDASSIVAAAHGEALLPSLHHGLTLLLTTTEQPNKETARKAWEVVKILAQRRDNVGDVVSKYYIDDIVLRMVLTWKKEDWTPALHEVAFAFGERIHARLEELNTLPYMETFCEKARTASDGLD